MLCNLCNIKEVLSRVCTLAKLSKHIHTVIVTWSIALQSLRSVSQYSDLGKITFGPKFCSNLTK